MAIRDGAQAAQFHLKLASSMKLRQKAATYCRGPDPRRRTAQGVVEGACTALYSSRGDATIRASPGAWIMVKPPVALAGWRGKVAGRGSVLAIV